MMDVRELSMQRKEIRGMVEHVARIDAQTLVEVDLTVNNPGTPVGLPWRAAGVLP